MWTSPNLRCAYLRGYDGVLWVVEYHLLCLQVVNILTWLCQWCDMTTTAPWYLHLWPYIPASSYTCSSIVVVEYLYSARMLVLFTQDQSHLNPTNRLYYISSAYDGGYCIVYLWWDQFTPEAPGGRDMDQIWEICIALMIYWCYRSESWPTTMSISTQLLAMVMEWMWQDCYSTMILPSVSLHPQSIWRVDQIWHTNTILLLSNLRSA